MNGKEPRLRAIGCLMAVALALLLMMAAASCSSHRNFNTESTASMQSIDTSVIDGKSGYNYDGWWWLSTKLDTLHISVKADSIIAPDGSRVHNPSIDVTAEHPVLDAAGGQKVEESDSIHAGAVKAVDSRSDNRVEKEAEAEALGKGWVILGLIAAFLLTVFTFVVSSVM